MLNFLPHGWGQGIFSATSLHILVRVVLLGLLKLKRAYGKNLDNRIYRGNTTTCHIYSEQIGQGAVSLYGVEHSLNKKTASELFSSAA